jgi:hypothetical protein
LAGPKAQIEKVMFWDVLEEFSISQRVLHQFTWNLDRNTQLIHAELVIERNLEKKNDVYSVKLV